MQIIGSSDLRKYYKEELEGKKIRIDRLVCSVNSLEYSVSSRSPIAALLILMLEMKMSLRKSFLIP
jgi:hypothetical protein